MSIETVNDPTPVSTGMTVRDLMHELLNVDMDAEVCIIDTADEISGITGTDTDEEGRIIIVAEA